MTKRFLRVPLRLFFLGLLSLTGWCSALPSAAAAETWIPAGSLWRYVADGSNLGTAWRSDDFDDSGWAVGPAQLGYGDGDEATLISGGPSGNRFITSYFRHYFTVAGAASITNLTLRILRDDGAVVYLNGLEVYRSNMPGGTVTSSTLASSAVSGGDENAFFTALINQSLLVEGLNSLAVEIHQNSPTSSDVSFDLVLEASRIPGPPVIIAQPVDQFVFPGATASFSVTAAGLEPLQYQWQVDGGDIAGATNSTLQIPNVTSDAVGSYRVLVRNPLGSLLSAEAVLELATITRETFQIAELSGTGPLAIEHGGVTGDDRGGIATSLSRVFVTGDSATAGFDLDDLGNPAIVPGVSRLDGLVGDLRSERAYSLGNGSVPVSGPSAVNTLIELDDVTGGLTTNIIQLSSTITMGFDSGIFASYGAVVLHNGSRVYRIEMPSGLVTDLGAMNRPGHAGAENWAYWGVAEFVAGTVYLVYVRDSSTIVRTRVPDGLTSTVAQFISLSDMASFTVSVADQRWYFHHEGSSQFRSGDETVGYADARFLVAPREEPPAIRGQPTSLILAEGSTAEFEVRVRQTGPVSYQWRFNGEDIPGATNNPLELSQVTSDVEGSYSVVITNVYGAVTSAPAALRVVRRALVSVFDNPFYVDTDGQLWSESDNLQESLRQRGYAVTTFTSILQATAGNNVLAFPRFQFGDLALAMDEATRNSLRLFVNQGGLLLVNGTPDDPGRTERFLNSTFGFSITAAPDFSGAPYQRTSGAVGTVFAEGPATLSFNNNMVQLTPASLPAGSQTIYQGTTGSVVTRIPYGSGKIVYLGWDWENAQPAGNQDGGWVDVLTLAVQESAVLAPSAPEFLLHPQSTSVLAGGTLTLSGYAFGSVPLSYQWQVNNVDLPGATNETLVISGMSTNDGGLYRLVATNVLGFAISSNALVKVVELSGDSFRITALSGAGASIQEHGQVTGDDRGGIALSANRVFYTGDSGTGIFDATTLEGSLAPILYDGLISDLRTEIVYTLGVGSRPIVWGDSRATTLLEIDGVTGLLTGDRIDLSAEISLISGVDQPGIFAGYGRIVIHNGARLFHISLPSGEVLDLGQLSPLAHAYTENWAYWGVAEFFAGNVQLVYVGNNSDVMRTRVNDGTTTVLGDFQSLSDMASITVSVRRNRWYFHHEGSSQFGSGDEVLGYANATFGVIQQLTPPTIVRQPDSRSVLDGALVTFTVSADGALPLSYRWAFNGQLIPGATDRTLRLTASLAAAGSYSVIVSNAYGVATSNPATLEVRPSRGVVGLYLDQSIQSPGAEAAITRAGFTPRQILDLGPENLSGLSLLVLQAEYNPIQQALLARVPSLREWVEDGGRLIVHHTASGAAGPQPDPLLLGAPGTLMGQESGAALQAVTSTLVTAGPHGAISNETMVNWVYGGSLVRQTLPVNAVQILRASEDSNRVVAASYTLGAGGVYFSTIPLEYYFQNSEPFGTIFQDVYLPNVIEHMAALAPAGPVVILSEPRNRTALAGSTVILEVSAAGAAPLSYQWQFNGSDLPGATGYQLQLTNVAAAAAGDYRVRISNPLGPVNTAVARLSLITPTPFRIVSLLTTGSRVVEHDALTGDDRGGIAASGTHVFYSGDNRTARFALGDLSGGTSLTRVFDGLVSDLRTEKVYSLAMGTNVIGGGGALVTSLVEINGSTGVPTTNVIQLSSPIQTSFDNGVFAGYGAMALHNGERVYRVELPSGAVTDLGPMLMPPHSSCENWAFWGVTEFVNGSVYLVYVRDSQAIVRTRVPDGLTTTVATFSSLSDMCSFTLSVSRNRWYFHHEGGSQFGGSSETVGYSSMVFDRPPIFPAMADQAAPEDTISSTIPFNISDPETPAASLIVRVESSNTNLLPQSNIFLGGSGNNRNLQLLGATNQSGTATVTVSVTDSIGTTASRSFTFTVRAVNDAPSFQPGADLTIFEDAGPQTIANWATNLRTGPPDESGQSLTFEVNFDNPGLFLQVPGIDTSGTLTYTPAPHAYGTAVVTAALRDNGGTDSGGVDLSATHSFTITIAPVNDAPAFVAGPDVSVRENAGPQTFASWATSIVAGPPNESSQALTFSITTDNPGLFAGMPAVVPDGTLTFTPAPGANGSAQVTVILRDDGGTDSAVKASAPQTFTISVTPVNDAPSFVKGPDLTVDEDAGTQTVAGWATGIRAGPPNETAQVLQFLVTSDNPALFSTPPSLAVNGTLTYAPAADANGSATVQVILRDDGGTSGGGVDRSAPQTFRIVVRPVNDPPVANPQTISASEDTALPITLTATDVDGDAMTYILVSQPAHGTLTGTAPDLSYTPAADYSGSDQFQFKVRDASSESGVATVSITVAPVNDAPVARATLRPTSNLFPNADYLTVIALNGSNATVVLDGTLSSDPENDPLEYFWLDYGSVPIGSGALSTNLLAVGSHTITLLVDDGVDTGTAVLEVEVVTAAEGVEALALMVNQANFDRQNKRPMIATLKAGAASFDRQNPISAINQLSAFQNKVRAQVGRTQPLLAEELIRGAQELIDLWNASMSR